MAGLATPASRTSLAQTSLDRKTIIDAMADLCGGGLIGDTGEFKGNTRQIPVLKLSSKKARNRGNFITG